MLLQDEVHELLRAVAEAAHTLHDPALDTAGVAGELERAVVDLGLARRATFLPEALPRSAREPGEELVTVYRQGGVVAGSLRCVEVAEQAQWPIRMLASHAGTALDTRARVTAALLRESALRAISEELQDALLPELPALPATVLQVAYRAAGAEARVGGDFYDVFCLPDGRSLIVVGDVVGKGVKAASHTARITHTMRALALQGFGLDELLERCDQQIAFQNPDIMATVWCGLYDPSSGELAFASLGHPPALLLRAEGEPITLSLEGLPLGLRDLSDTPPEIRTRLLSPRDLLVLYTDGVVEASRDYVAGQKALLEAVSARRDEPLSQSINPILDDMLAGAGHRDDAVLLLLRRR